MLQNIFSPFASINNYIFVVFIVIWYTTQLSSPPSYLFQPFSNRHVYGASPILELTTYLYAQALNRLCTSQGAHNHQHPFAI
jgi:hypothetical protein